MKLYNLKFCKELLPAVAQLRVSPEVQSVVLHTVSDLSYNVQSLFVQVVSSVLQFQPPCSSPQDDSRRNLIEIMVQEKSIMTTSSGIVYCEF